MSDDEQDFERHSPRNDDDDRDRLEDLTGKKVKKKKKSSSKSKSDKSTSPSNGVPTGTTGPSFAGKIALRVGDSISTVREHMVMVTDIRNTSRKAMMTRVLLLVLLSITVMGIGQSFFFGEDTPPPAAAPEPEPEEVIVQKLPGKKSQKVNLAMEKDFACRELQCVAQCNGKAKPKCLKSRSCVAERDKICQKRCRKTRCEDRCKDEPHLGYVEREQGLEKCKDACTGPTAVHNKCVVKCHIKYKPCKSRCYETATKFKCDNPKILAMVNQQQTPGVPPGKGESSKGGGDDDEDGDGDGGGGGDAEDDEEGGGDGPPPPKKKAAPGGLEDDELL